MPSTSTKERKALVRLRRHEFEMAEMGDVHDGLFLHGLHPRCELTSLSLEPRAGSCLIKSLARDINDRNSLIFPAGRDDAPKLCGAGSRLARLNCSPTDSSVAAPQAFSPVGSVERRRRRESVQRRCDIKGLRCGIVHLLHCAKEAVSKFSQTFLWWKRAKSKGCLPKNEK